MISESEILFWMSLAGISLSKQTKAIKHCAHITDIWKNLPADQTLQDIFADKCGVLTRYRSERYVASCLDKLHALDIKVMSIYNPCYSELLRQPEVGAPYVFYYRGNQKLFASDCIAVVGTRACSDYGKRMTQNIAGTLAENGITVVSGLATGIDYYAHEAALEAGGNTIAVLGSGLNKVSPVGNKPLFDRILDNGGAVMSEYLPNATATKYSFPERNRLISGLSKGVCVVEAGAKSGALITAKNALEQNRDVFAVPGNAGNIRSEGTNNLLYEGAFFIRGGEDILNHYGMTAKKDQNFAKPQITGDAQRIYEIFLTNDTVSFDEIVEKLELAPQKVSVALTQLEIDGYILKMSPNEFAKNGD